MKIILAAICALSLSTAIASAQSSQGNVGPGTDGSLANKGSSTSNSNMGTGMAAPTTDSSMKKSGSGMKNDSAANPSSQGNVGPGTTPGNPGSSK